MPFRDPDNFLRDIADAIGMSETFTYGMELESFREDRSRYVEVTGRYDRPAAPDGAPTGRWISRCERPSYSNSPSGL